MVDLLGADNDENLLFNGVVEALNKYDDLIVYACVDENLDTTKYKFDKDRGFYCRWK